MKILVISHMYPSVENPAYGIFIHDQVKALVNQGCEVKVISPVPYAPWPLTSFRKKWKSYAAIPKKDYIAGVQVYYPRYPEFPRSYFLEHSGYFMYLGLKKLVKRIYQEFEFDLIHAHVALPDGHAAFMLKKEFDVPTVVTVHGQDFQSTIHLGEKCRNRLCQVLSGTDKIITVSNKLKNIVKDQAFSSKISVINNGIDLGECTYMSSANNNKANIKKIISVSNLKKTKGIDINIKALSHLAQKYPELKYYIVGDGEERLNLENLVTSLNLQDKVVFLGKLAHPEALSQMGEADIFCLPSWQEGFGVVYIEAMAQGVPVIGVQGEGIEDVITHGSNGLLVRPHSVEDVVEVLETLISDPVYAKSLAEKGREKVRNEYTWDQNAKKTIELYKELKI